MWLGGAIPLGYNVVEKQLKINQEEAKQVQYIFEKYLEFKSFKITTEHLNEEGYCLKKWTSQKGKKWGGGKFTVGNVSRALKNKLYIGKIEHKRLNEIYEGKHEAIIDKEIFDQVQNLLDENRVDYHTTKKIRHVLLYKKLFTPAGEEFIKKEGKVHGRHYSYYIVKGKHLPMNQMDDVILRSVETFLNGDFKDQLPSHTIEQIKRIFV